MKTTQKLLMLRSEQGAQFMDKHCPKWYRDVNPKILDIEDANNCVFGQKYGNYVVAKEHFGLSYMQTLALGFNGKSSWEFTILTKGWCKEIVWRRRRDNETSKAKSV